MRIQSVLLVAPHAGAWIEMKRKASVKSVPMSLPMRERGLKFAMTEQAKAQTQSLPMRERGLKLC